MILIYFIINGPAYNASKCALPGGHYNTMTRVADMCDVMNEHYTFDPPAKTFPTRFGPHPNPVNNTVSIYNRTNEFELFTD